MPRKKRVSTVTPLLLTIPEVATMLQVCENTVYHLIYDEGLPSLTLGDQRERATSDTSHLAERMVEESGGAKERVSDEEPLAIPFAWMPSGTIPKVLRE